MGDKVPAPRPLAYVPLSPNQSGVKLPLPPSTRPAGSGVEGVIDDFPRRKRSRITRACDTCRKKKIRCDMESGHPCTTCKTYQWECTFLEQAKKRGPSKGYIDSLETRLKKMEALLENLNHKDGSSKARHKRSISQSRDESESVDDDHESDTQSYTPEAERSEHEESDTSHYLHHQPSKPAQNTVQTTDTQQKTSPKPVAGTTVTPTANFSPPSLDHPTPSSTSSQRVTTSEDVKPNVIECRATKYMGSSSGVTFLSKIAKKSEEVFRSAQPLMSSYKLHENGYDGILLGVKAPKAYLPETSPMPKELSDKLVKIYFDLFFTGFPILDKRAFLRQYNGESETKPPLLLLMSIYSVTITCISPDDELLKKYPEITQKSLHLQLSELLRAGLAQNFLEQRIATVQALVILACHNTIGEYQNTSWVYTGIAVRISQELGLHRSSESWNMSKSEVELRKRIWWGCYIVDRWSAAGLGRPLCIADEDCDVELPTVNPELDDENVPMTPEETKHSTTMVEAFNSFITLTQIVGHMLRTIYGRKKKDNDMDANVKVLMDELAKWRSQIPQELRFDSSSDEINEFSARLEICYQSTLLVIHRPYIISYEPGVGDQKHFLMALNICTNAANFITHITEVLLEKRLLKTLWAFSFYGVFQATILHLYNATSTDTRLSVPARVNLQRCINSLEQARGQAASNKIIQIFERIMHAKDVQFAPREDYDAYVRAQNHNYKDGDHRASDHEKPAGSDLTRPLPTSLSPVSPPLSVSTYASTSPRIPISELPRGPKIFGPAAQPVQSIQSAQSHLGNMRSLLPPTSNNIPFGTYTGPHQSPSSIPFQPHDQHHPQLSHLTPIPWRRDPTLISPSWLPNINSSDTSLFADSNNSFWEFPLVFDFYEWENWMGHEVNGAVGTAEDGTL